MVVFSNYFRLTRKRLNSLVLSHLERQHNVKKFRCYLDALGSEGVEKTTQCLTMPPQRKSYTRRIHMV